MKKLIFGGLNYDYIFSYIVKFGRTHSIGVCTYASIMGDTNLHYCNGRINKTTKVVIQEKEVGPHSLFLLNFKNERRDKL